MEEWVGIEWKSDKIIIIQSVSFSHHQLVISASLSYPTQTFQLQFQCFIFESWQLLGAWLALSLKNTSDFFSPFRVEQMLPGWTKLVYAWINLRQCSPLLYGIVHSGRILLKGTRNLQLYLKESMNKNVNWSTVEYSPESTFNKGVAQRYCW